MQAMKINIFSPKIQNILFDYSQEVTMEQGLRVESQVFQERTMKTVQKLLHVREIEKLENHYRSLNSR